MIAHVRAAVNAKSVCFVGRVEIYSVAVECCSLGRKNQALSSFPKCLEGRDREIRKPVDKVCLVRYRKKAFPMQALSDHANVCAHNPRLLQGQNGRRATSAGGVCRILILMIDI